MCKGLRSQMKEDKADMHSLEYNLWKRSSCLGIVIYDRKAYMNAHIHNRI